MANFNGQTAVITGGAQGIGLATAKRFIEDGCEVMIWDVDEKMGLEASKELKCQFLKVDQTENDLVEEATKKTIQLMKKIDILVCSAGIAGPTFSTWDYPIEEWSKVFNVNVNGVFYCNKHVVKTMRDNGYGRIINIASIAGKEGNPNASAYSASKAAVIALTKSLGKETADHDIAVNCITPATAKTRILDQVSQEFIDYMISKIPRNRFVKVEEIASLITFLASKENSFTTAGVFDISGGRATY
ncbi:SDR family NAD(P)-dependent oxidoreductase [Alphaproteobacteria bacterium]|jgi:3-oxoacyl-[acyl-carrier protein] reductase|nr:SDR family oxidoreductase [Alphaproteobacteria bacterium]MDC1023380.1 SDR family NAD(P)-dependent oxidoreductase [Alphaproteobacteria bacterium]MDC1111313.1 SDR family NAD(P)-dependent oxidoreductase [Alphaproteobacteria bacterium]MDC3273636.1 SDR family oxidoreductase [Alphaproteobacteria bacterium]MDG1467078.1 SDR family NAD(P)-dependent oxidoreductase [Alphaproteobacteria bacterium]|tara:strand:+ start:6422 stop:7156 length:735 start_codon:yes stop_codon:yes gene_type:complete